MTRYDEPLFLISVVAKQLDIHPQTLRQYEREGLVEPSRTEGKVRLYSQKDIDRVRLILNLTREMGVNLAGVEVILRLNEQLAQAHSEINTLRSRLGGGVALVVKEA